MLTALRQAIRPSIASFRASMPRPLVCAVSGALLTEDAVHVDHAAPRTFLALATAFAHAEGGFGSIAVAPSVDGEIARRLTLTSTREQWVAFHDRRARLRIVSPTTNLSTLRRGVPRGAFSIGSAPACT